MKNVAIEVIKPEKSDTFRVIFLNVGQGESTLLAIPNKDGAHKYALIDSNVDSSVDGVDLIEMLEDLLGGESLDYYINTHPHKDHNAKIKEIQERFGISELWHSGHTPKGDHKSSFEEMKDVINQLGSEKVFLLKGTNSKNKVRNSKDEKDVIRELGSISYQVLAPAEYVKDDIEDENVETHYARIHEYCAVIKLTYGNPEKSILITGDSNCIAWKKHIVEYHKGILKSDILSASHHGSKDFFWENGDVDLDVYLEHMDSIKPEYLVISAPKESKHGHPHEEALEQYKKYLIEENIFNLGEGGYCLVVDINSDGTIFISKDKSLIEEYCSNESNRDKKNKFSYPKEEAKPDPKRFA